MYDSVRGSGRRYGNKRYRGVHRDPGTQRLHDLILALGVLTAVALGTLALLQVRDAPARSFNHLTPPTAGVVDEWIPPEPVLSPESGGGWVPPAPPRQHPSPGPAPASSSSSPDPTPTPAAGAFTPTPAATGTPAPSSSRPSASPTSSAKRSRPPRPRVKGWTPPVDYVEAPTEYTGTDPAVFLAGGITDCPDWQSVACDLLADAPCVVLNPRRADFPIHSPEAADGQIDWEFRHLRRADVVLFWFPASASVQPIALYELGAHAAMGKPIAVGTDSSYSRRMDVALQLEHVRPEVHVYHSLPRLVAEARRILLGAPPPAP